MRPIDADALKDGYMHMGYDPNEHPEESYMEGWCKGFNAAVDHCIGHVIHAPTIEPERKKGKWIVGANHGLMVHTLTCDQCNHSEVSSSVPNFCPNCGADMRGEQNGQT